MCDKDGATPVVDKDPSTAFPSTVRERRMDLKPHGMSVEQKLGGRQKGRKKGREMHEEIKMRKQRQSYKIKNGQKP